MSSKGVGTLHFIDGIMDKWGYLDILKKNVKQSAQKMGLTSGYMFQQDNDPKHTAEVCKQWLIWNVPKQLKTPAQSPDLNLIEHLWVRLKRQVSSKNVSSKTELKQVVTEEWNKIQPSTCKRLVNSMQRRCVSVLKARGYSSTY